MKTSEYNGNLTLFDASGDITVPCHITDEESEYNANITVKIVYLGKKYTGYGKDMEWTEAFADLQKALPNGVRIKCCLTCRHGNMCPYGNIPNLILCTQSDKIQSKDDLIGFLDRTNAEEIRRESTGVCDRFEFASNRYYTYNDFGDYSNR